MYALGSLLITILRILSPIVWIYFWIITISAFISWVNPDPYNPIVRFLRQVTEPVFRQVRRILPRAFFRSRIDFTPMIVGLILLLIQMWAIPILIIYISSWMGPPPR